MRRKNFHGVFLLEALLAVFILSVALVGLIRGLLSSLNASAEAERYADAINVADNALLEVTRLNGQKVETGVILTDLEDEFVVKVAVVPSDNEQIPALLQEAHLVVSWPGKVKDKEIEAVTLIFGSDDEKK